MNTYNIHYRKFHSNLTLGVSKFTVRDNRNIYILQVSWMSRGGDILWEEADHSSAPIVAQIRPDARESVSQNS